MSKELAALLLLTGLDRNLLTAYCQAHALWTEAVASIGRYGTMVKSPNGFPMQSPYGAVANKRVDIMVQIAAEFGMTLSRTLWATSRREIPSRRPSKTVAKARSGDDPVTVNARRCGRRKDADQSSLSCGLPAASRGPRKRRSEGAFRCAGGAACHRLLRIPAP